MAWHDGGWRDVVWTRSGGCGLTLSDDGGGELELELDQETHST